MYDKLRNWQVRTFEPWDNETHIQIKQVKIMQNHLVPGKMCAGIQAITATTHPF